MTRLAVVALLAGLAVSPAGAGFRSPESLIRNVYAHYGKGSSDFSKGLPRDAETKVLLGQDPDDPTIPPTSSDDHPAPYSSADLAQLPRAQGG